MENLKFRKKQPTYGKSNKKFPIHQIFDTTPLSEKLAGFVPTPDSPSTLKKAHVGGTFRTRDSAEEVDLSPANYGLNRDSTRPIPHPTAQSVDAYEIESSDDDTQDSGYSEPKRRKLTPQLNEETFAESLSATERPTSRKLVAKRRPVQKLQDFHRVKPTMASDIGSKTTTKSKAIEIDDDSISATESASPSSMASPSRAEVDSPPATPPRQSRKTAGTPNLRTPRHQEPMLPGGIDKKNVDSPSQLGLRSLRLTPEKPTPEKRDIFDEVAAHPTQLTPRRGRQRLVDRLDAPFKPSSHSPSPTGVQKNSSRSSSIGGSAKIGPPSLVKEASFEINLEATTIEDSSQEYSAPAAIKSKRSYAQQRSYLTDPTLKSALDIDAGAPDDVHSLLSSQNQSGGHGGSQLELEKTDDNTPTAGTGTKSIHELRRAGANNRFDGEIQDLLNDLAKSDSTRSIRVHALTKILGYLHTPEYATKLLETQLESKLNDIAIRDYDMLTSALLTSIFLISTGIEGRPDIPKRIQSTIVILIATQLLEKRSLVTIAKERKANLSKLAIKDVAEAEKGLTPNLSWDAMMPENISPQLLAISTLASMTKTIRLNGQAYVNPSEAFLKQVFQVVEEANSDARVTDDSILLIKAAMSFLENSSQTTSALGLDEPRSFTSFATTLSSILRTLGKQKVEIQQTCLRTIVNLSNNEAQVSTVLAATPILEEVFEVVQHNFNSLATAADADQVVDQDQLNSVILALGCLMNLVECSEEARNRFFEMGTPPRSSVDWLLDHFDQRVEKSFSVSLIIQNLARWRS